MHEKVGNVFGARVPFFDKIPGSDEANVRAVIDKVTSNLTLDKIKNFKGAISDKDLEIAQSAATTLQRRNITDAEARREIDRLFNSLNSGSETQQENPAQAGGEWTEANQAELDALEREYGHLLGG